MVMTLVFLAVAKATFDSPHASPEMLSRVMNEPTSLVGSLSVPAPTRSFTFRFLCGEATEPLRVPYRHRPVRWSSKGMVADSDRRETTSTDYGGRIRLTFRAPAQGLAGADVGEPSSENKTSASPLSAMTTEPMTFDFVIGREHFSATAEGPFEFALAQEYCLGLASAKAALNRHSGIELIEE